MRIGIDCRVLSGPPCGIASYTGALVRALADADRGHEYILFSDKPFSTGIVVPAACKTVIVRGSGRMRWEQFILPGVLHSHSIDVFHCPHNHGVPLRKICPVVLTVHDLIPYLFNRYWQGRPFLQKTMYRWLMKRSVRKADMVIAVSRHTMNDVKTTFHIPDGRLRVIYEGLTPGIHEGAIPFEKVSSSFGITKPYLLHLGGIGFNKNTAMVIKAFERLKNRGNFSCQLVIVGPQEYFRELPGVRDVKREGIIFTGMVDDATLACFYRHARVFLYPSLYEGFGLPVLEAFSHGVPVITCRSASIPEIAGDAAVYTDPVDAEALADTVVSLVSDDMLRSRMAKFGADRLKEFSWQSAARETIQLYKSLVR